MRARPRHTSQRRERPRRTCTLPMVACPIRRTTAWVDSHCARYSHAGSTTSMIVKQ